MGVNDWSCRKCTFLHKLEGTRCSMCGELRTSRDQMRQFVLGNKNTINGGEENVPPIANPNPKPNQTVTLPTRQGTVTFNATRHNISHAKSKITNTASNNNESTSMNIGMHISSTNGKKHRTLHDTNSNQLANMKRNMAGLQRMASSLINPYAKKKRTAVPLTKNLLTVDMESDQTYAATNTHTVTHTTQQPLSQTKTKTSQQKHHNNASISTRPFPSLQADKLPIVGHTSKIINRPPLPPPPPPHNPYAKRQKIHHHPPIHNKLLPLGEPLQDSQTQTQTQTQTKIGVHINRQSTTTTQHHKSSVHHTIQKQPSTKHQQTLTHNNVVRSSHQSTMQHQYQQQQPTHQESRFFQNKNCSVPQQPPVVTRNPYLSHRQERNNTSVIDIANHVTTAITSSKRKLQHRVSSQHNLHSSNPTSEQITHPVPANSKRQLRLQFSPTQQHRQSNHHIITNTTRRPYPNYQPGPIPLAPDPIPRTWIYPQSLTYAERDYQLSMSKSAILQNTLVSLPTGLGKTLIAAVVIYNFYRWFPTGKVLFLAPTRPLVTQQIEACYNMVGISERHTAEMSGKSKPSHRTELWNKRRVFFCTPQTCEKDIKEGRCDARRIVCIVFDEAHKALGKYAYTNVIKLVEKAGAKFRVVGLSATPGKNLENVRKVLENLRISKIDSRSEDDPNVRKYVHERRFEVIKVQPSTKGAAVDRLLGILLNPLIDQLRSRNALPRFRGSNEMLPSYSVMLAMKEFYERDDHTLTSHFIILQALLRVREALRENGIGLARTKLLSFMRDQGCKGVGQRIAKSKEYLSLWAAVVDAQDTGHNPNQRMSEDFKLNNPKLQKLDEILKEHFERTRACGQSSRAIVFSQWRDSVEEIVNVLSGSGSLIKAKKFVGQSGGSAATEREDGTVSSLTRGKKTYTVGGMNQKEQQRVIKEFRAGIHNVLVCTCIGEEGLDIGEVDLIVNYDSLRSPIRMIQRTGRTGRKRDGRVVALVSAGQEERKLEKSEADTKTLWRALQKGSSIFNFTKNLPLLPEVRRELFVRHNIKQLNW